MRSALTNVTGVISADVSLPDKAVVKVQTGKVTEKKLIEAVKKAGYGAKVADQKKENTGKKPS